MVVFVLNIVLSRCEFGSYLEVCVEEPYGFDDFRRSSGASNAWVAVFACSVFYLWVQSEVARRNPLTDLGTLAEAKEAAVSPTIACTPHFSICWVGVCVYCDCVFVKWGHIPASSRTPMELILREGRLTFRQPSTACLAGFEV